MDYGDCENCGETTDLFDGLCSHCCDELDAEEEDYLSDYED